MEYSFNFNKFNPQSDKVPELFYEQCFYIISKAKSYINKRKPNELNYAISTINYLFDKKTKEFENLTEAAYITTPTILLNHSIQLFDINNQSDFPNATWPEYFAITALALISEINNLSNESNRDNSIYDYAGKCIVDAMELICWADRLTDKSSNDEFKQVSVENEVIKRLSDKNQIAAIQGWEEVNEFKFKYFDFIPSRQWKSFAESRRIFLRQYDKEIPKRITKLHRVLTDALREYRKKHPSIEQYFPNN